MASAAATFILLLTKPFAFLAPHGFCSARARRVRQSWPLVLLLLCASRADPYRVLVVGASSYIGQHVVSRLHEQAGSTGVVIGATTSGRDKQWSGRFPSSVHVFTVDYTDDARLLGDSWAIIRAEFGQPNVVINCVGLTSLGKAESFKNLARKLNAPPALLTFIRDCERAPLLIQLSTDKVYDGEHAPYSEDSVSNPINEYGRSKLAFEEQIKSSLSHYCIMRLSVVIGGPAPFLARQKFLEWLNGELAKAVEPVGFFSDEKLNFVFIHDVVAAVMAAVDRDRNSLVQRQDLFNMGGLDSLSRADLAHAVARVGGYDDSMVEEISSTTGGTSGARGTAKTPRDTSMDSTLVQGAHGLHVRFTPLVDGLTLALDLINNRSPTPHQIEI
jgi:dTDP-4-dehydrorhamnose reductase